MCIEHPPTLQMRIVSTLKIDIDTQMETKVEQEIVSVHRVWIQRPHNGEKVAAVPLRVLEKCATMEEFPHENVPQSVKSAIRCYYQYYLEQLRLFHEVAYMRNYCGVKTIKKMLPEEVVFSGMNEVTDP